MRDDFREQSRRRVGREPVAVRREKFDRLRLAAIRAVAPRFFVHVDVRETERCEKAVHGISFVRPFLDFLLRKFRAARRAGEQIDDVMRRFVAGIDDHVAQGAAQFLGVLQLAVFHPAMRGDEVKKFDDARGINLFAAAITGLNRSCRVAQIYQRHGEFVGAEFFVREFLQRGSHGGIDDALQLLRMRGIPRIRRLGVGGFREHE